jgi:segregation and condensation protein B
MSPALDRTQLKLVIESVLFVAEGPVDLRTLARLADTTPEEVAAAVEELAAEWKGRGVRLQRSAQAVQLVSAPETAQYVQQYLGIDEHQRLSPVVLVTLTVIAYKQPVTRGEVERILKKNCDYSVMVLKARELITEVGRADGPGRPYLYGTTFKFLEHFGLEKPEDLPPLPELEIAAEAAAAAPAEETDDEGLPPVDESDDEGLPPVDETDDEGLPPVDAADDDEGLPPVDDDGPDEDE